MADKERFTFQPTVNSEYYNHLDSISKHFDVPRARICRAAICNAVDKYNRTKDVNIWIHTPIKNGESHTSDKGTFNIQPKFSEKYHEQVKKISKSLEMPNARICRAAICNAVDKYNRTKDVNIWMHTHLEDANEG